MQKGKFSVTFILQKGIQSRWFIFEPGQRRGRPARPECTPKKLSGEWYTTNLPFHFAPQLLLAQLPSFALFQRYESSWCFVAHLVFSWGMHGQLSWENFVERKRIGRMRAVRVPFRDSSGFGIALAWDQFCFSLEQYDDLSESSTWPQVQSRILLELLYSINTLTNVLVVWERIYLSDAHQHCVARDYNVVRGQYCRIYLNWQGQVLGWRAQTAFGLWTWSWNHFLWFRFTVVMWMLVPMDR